MEILLVYNTNMANTIITNTDKIQIIIHWMYMHIMCLNLVLIIHSALLSGPIVAK